jgi:hypothetical protein
MSRSVRLLALAFVPAMLCRFDVAPTSALVDRELGLPTHCCHSVATIRRLKAVVDQTSCLYLVPALGQPICAAR